jgi:hypothetical protein
VRKENFAVTILIIVSKYVYVTSRPIFDGTSEVTIRHVSDPFMVLKDDEITCRWHGDLHGSLIKQ